MRFSVPTEPLTRRDFFKWFAGIVLGAAAALIPIGSAIVLLLDPARRKSEQSGLFVRVAPMAALPADGVPRKFTVTANRTDAWNKYNDVPVGAIYLRRTGATTVSAFNAICPHAGGFIDYHEQCQCYICPLHNSQFALDGSIQDPRSPAPRGMDSLPVEIRGDEIWVRFENFQAGVRQKIPA